MGSQDPSDKLSPEELQKLIDLASAPSTSPNDDKELDEVERFIVAVGIKPGEAMVTPYRIWRRYRVWKNGEKGFLLCALMKRFHPHFKSHYLRKTKDRFYLLDPTPFEWGDEVDWELRKELRDRRKKQLDERKKKDESDKG